MVNMDACKIHSGKIGNVNRRKYPEIDPTELNKVKFKKKTRKRTTENKEKVGMMGSKFNLERGGGKDL